MHTPGGRLPPPYLGGGQVWSIALQAFSRTMTTQCLASGGEAGRRQDTVNEKGRTEGVGGGVGVGKGLECEVEGGGGAEGSGGKEGGVSRVR